MDGAPTKPTKIDLGECLRQDMGLAERLYPCPVMITHFNDFAGPISICNRGGVQRFEAHKMHLEIDLRIIIIVL